MYSKCGVFGSSPPVGRIFSQQPVELSSGGESLRRRAVIRDGRGSKASKKGAD